MRIQAKFSSVCPSCRKWIREGETVEWSRGKPARHVKCPSKEERCEAKDCALGGPWAVLCIVEDAPLPVAKAAFKALARIHHPDAGGSSEAMQRLNAAYQEIERLYGGKQSVN